MHAQEGCLTPGMLDQYQACIHDGWKWRAPDNQPSYGLKSFVEFAVIFLSAQLKKMEPHKYKKGAHLLVHGAKLYLEQLELKTRATLQVNPEK